MTRDPTINISTLLNRLPYSRTGLPPFGALRVGRLPFPVDRDSPSHRGAFCPGGLVLDRAPMGLSGTGAPEPRTTLYAPDLSNGCAYTHAPAEDAMAKTPPELGEHPRGTLALVALYGLLFGALWLFLYFGVFLERGAITP